MGLAAPIDTAVASTRTSAAEVAASGEGGPLSLEGDALHASNSARRARSAWKGRRITYYETLPAKWQWSLDTAVAKWNNSGGRIRFVPTKNRRKAKLTIAYGSLGGAAGMATVGRVRRAFVRLNSGYNSVDSLDAHNRIEVMMILAHELGHVLGFGHSSTRCSLMSSMLDVAGCNAVPTARPGYYQCRTIDAALVTRFVRSYGGRARYPAPWCPIDTIPEALHRVDFSGGVDSPVTITWVAPRAVPSGSRIVVRSWHSEQCTAAPADATTTAVPLSPAQWQEPLVEPGASSCFSVGLVNRYGAGRSEFAGRSVA